MSEPVYVWMKSEEVPGATRAFAEPAFLIKKDGVFYLTKAVWIYDPEHAETQEHREDYEAMRAYFNETVGEDGVFAAPVRTRPRGRESSHTR